MNATIPGKRLPPLLPPEILGVIFAFLDTDKVSFSGRLQTLRRCCLVSRSFLPFARECLYRELYARSTGSQETDCAALVATLRMSPHLATLPRVVHCLHLSFDRMSQETSHALASLLERCSNLQHLVLFGFGRDELPDLMACIVRSCTDLRRLEIDSRHRRPFDGQACLDALKSLRKVEGLSLLGAQYLMEDNSKIDHPGFKQLMLPPLGSSIFDTLASSSHSTLQSVTFTLEMGCMAPIDFSSFVQLSRISLTLSSDMTARMDELYLICDYLDTCVALQDLRVGATYPKAWLGVDLRGFICALPENVKRLDVSSFQLPQKAVKGLLNDGRYRYLKKLEYSIATWTTSEEEEIRLLLESQGIKGQESLKVW